LGELSKFGAPYPPIGDQIRFYGTAEMNGLPLVRDRRALTPSFKLWLGDDRSHVLGKGAASLLKAIHRYGSIAEAAKRTGMSYKYAWDRLADIEGMLGQPALRTKRGGRGGGGSELTEAAIRLLKSYERTEKYLRRVLKDGECWEAMGLRISARNRLKGIVEGVEKGQVASKVKIRVRAPAVITALITKEAVEELGIKPGDEVEAVIKATEVMVAKE
jgi:molybdate transport system regulatory protein